MIFNATPTSSSTAYVMWSVPGYHRPPDPPAAGVAVPAPEPFPPGPLAWEARRLDELAELAP
jgi:hypothetical protein